VSLLPSWLRLKLPVRPQRDSLTALIVDPEQALAKRRRLRFEW